MRIKRYSLKLRSLGMMLLFSVTFVQAVTKTSIGTGNWNTAAIWNSGVPTASDNAIINTSVTIDNLSTVEVNDLTINTGTGKLVVEGTLIVDGNLTMDFSGNNESELVLSPGCRVIVNGNVALGNKVSLALSSYFIVRGDFYKQGSAAQGAISISGAHIYILGTVSTPWSNFSTNGNAYSGTTGSISDLCDYGTSVDLAKNLDIIPTEILASFNCNSSTTPSWNGTQGIPHSGGSVSTGGTIQLTAEAKSAANWYYQPVSYHWRGPNNFSTTTTHTTQSIGSATPAMSGYYVCTAMNTKGCSITDSIYVVVSSCLPSGYEYYSRDNYTGLWTDPLTWGTNNPDIVVPPPYGPNNSHSIGISGYITVNGDLTLGTSTQYLCDTLVVTGNFLATNPTLTIGPNGVLVVLGDYVGSSGSIINNQGRIIVAGNFQNPQSWSVIKNNDGDVYVFDQSPVLGGLNPTGWNTIDLNSADNPLFKFYCTLAGGNCPANPVITSTTSASRCGTGTVTLQATASPSGSVIKWYNQATGGTLLGTGTSYTTPVISTTTSYYVDATNNGITSSPRTTVTATVQQPASATISYAGTPFCKWLTAPQNVTLTGTSGGTYTAYPSGLNIHSGTGAIVPVASVPGTYTVTYTIPGTGECGVVTSSTEVIIIGDLVWSGSVNTDWNESGNWHCGVIPDLTTNVRIPNVPNQPILQSGAEGAAKNIVIQSGSSVTVSGNKLRIAGTITNNGTFIASNGTIEMSGSSAQTIPANTFATNTLLNLIVDNASGVTLEGALYITGILKASSGNLATGGYLTLVSSSSQTALIDGTGTGNVTGNVTMQRYLSSAFGYKYFSSPFQSATVNEFADDMDLNAVFPTLYRYDENHLSPTGTDVSGWIVYKAPGGTLNPLEGYAVNFGSVSSAKTTDMTGVVNNGSLNINLMNHNRIYTKGFNLVGNPYPSPIDWNNPGWTKSNIDNAIYFFNAGNTDQYTGVYSSYVNGVSTGDADNNIASMQGFFVHVTNGAYPVNATLGTTNSVRVNDLNPTFKKAIIDDRVILRFTASLETKNPIEDALVIYFDEMATQSFDKEQDALKLMNTDILVPNLYTLAPESKQLSISGILAPTDSIIKVPLGLTTFSDGWINFNAKDISQLPLYLHIYLFDTEKSILQDLRRNPEYRFNLKPGEYNQRFSLVFSPLEINEPTTLDEKMFTCSYSSDQLSIKMNLPFSEKGNLMVTNMVGQTLLLKQVFEKETVEISTRLSGGVFVVTVISGKRKESEKILIRKDYE